ncbi:response regulator transcription factor [Facklamia sp. P13064]
MKRWGDLAVNKVLIIEDNIEIANQIQNYILSHDYLADIAHSYYEALEKINITYDVALLDINLPDKEGHHLIEQLKVKDIRVIITSVKNDEDFIIRSLDSGADDYLIKPFSLAILRARLDAVLRTIPLTENKTLAYKDIEIDLTRSQVHYHHQSVNLTALEYEILLLFLKNPHRVYTRSHLMQMFWEDRDKYVNDNTLTSTIKRIREKLDKDVITTIRGIGYRMD